MDLSKFGEATTQEPGHYRDAATGKVFFVTQGRRIELPPLETKDFDEIENYYRSRVLSPLDAIAAALPELQKAPPAVREYMMEKAYADLRKGAEIREVSQRDIALWIDSRPGMTYQFFLQLRKKIPGLTLEDVGQIVAGITTDALAQARRATCDRLREIGDAALAEGKIDALLTGQDAPPKA